MCNLSAIDPKTKSAQGDKEHPAVVFPNNARLF